MALGRLACHHLALVGLLDTLSGRCARATRHHVLGSLGNVASAHVASVQAAILPFLCACGLPEVGDTLRWFLASTSAPLSDLLASASADDDDFLDRVVLLRDAMEALFNVERELLWPVLQSMPPVALQHLEADIDAATTSHISLESLDRLSTVPGNLSPA